METTADTPLFEFSTDAGQLTGPRSEQNDVYSFGPRSAVLADGMGSGSAPRAAATEVAAYYGSLIRMDRANEMEVELRRAPSALGHRLQALGLDAGSTASAALLGAGDNLWLTNTGDSMSVLIRESKILYHNPLHNQVTTSHGPAGKDSVDPYRLSKYIARKRSFTPELVRFPAHDGDIVILMSDGVHTKVPLEQLTAIVAEERLPGAIGYEILRHAAMTPLRDNATCVVAAIHSKIGERE